MRLGFLSTHLDYPEDTLGLDTRSPEGARAVAERDELRIAVHSLTPKQRFVVKRLWGLHDGYEYSEREVGEAMGISGPAVHHLHNRALATLQRKLGVSS